MQSNARPIVLIGAGQAGSMAVAALRELGHEGEVVMLAGERHAPYERPPLSKSVLADASEAPAINILPLQFYAEKKVDLRLGHTAVSINRDERSILTSEGARVFYSKCLLATGGAARTLPQLPAGTLRVHYLRTLDDALALKLALRATSSLLVLGGGFLGLETASTARAMGVEVTLIERDAALLSRALPLQFSDWLSRRAAAYGVQVRVGRGIAGKIRAPE